jgi:O-antigen ligase
MRKLPAETESHVHYGIVVAGVATLLFFLLAAACSWLSSRVALTVIGFGIFLVALLIAGWAAQLSRRLDSAKSYQRLALVVWWSLLVSEEPFKRFTPEAESFAGHFSAAAYGEAAFWVIACFALLIVSRFQCLPRRLSSGNKWLALFGLVCLVSAPFSPTPLYSLVWAFRLSLVVLLLLFCSANIHDQHDIESFFWSNLWGFFVVALAQVVRAFLNPSGAFEGGRLSGTPTATSAAAATFVLLALTFNSLRRRTWLTGLAIASVGIMIMAGGKAGIAAGIASLMLFFALQKRFAAGFGWLFGILLVGCIVFAVTPISSYFTAYQEAGELSSLTGRTDLWTTVWPEIMQHPVVGHGYLASRFLAEETVGVFPAASHMHNGFIEALYNNGLIGLTIIVVIHFLIVRNLWRSFKNPPNGNGRLLTIGSWAIYFNLLVNGLFSATFSGRTDPAFMLLLGLLVVSEKLRGMMHPLHCRTGEVL